jgi:hypothetical protein
MSRTEKFEPVEKLELWEAEDHYVIQNIQQGSHLTSEFRVKITSAKVKVLCELFGIPYDPKWTIYLIGKEKHGAQITINKQPKKEE